MNIFGIGPLEIVFVLIIGILVLGPEGMIEAGRKLGKFIRSIVRSTWWQNIRRGVNELQYLPNRLMREAELEELNELTKFAKDEFPKIGKAELFEGSAWMGNSPSSKEQKNEDRSGSSENSISQSDH